MNQSALEHLSRAERYVGRDQRFLTRQRRIVANLERGGQDSIRSKYLLRLFEQMLAIHLAHRDRVRDQLRPAVAN
jgi:hypothetical protein